MTHHDDHPGDLERRRSLRRLGALWTAIALPLAACSGGDDGAPPPPPSPPSGPPGSGGGAPPPPPPPPPASGTPRTTVLNSTLDSPWGLAFLPDGKMLVTQKSGSIIVLSANGANKLGTLAMNGVSVANAGQGGMLDIVLDPDFATPGSNWVYFSYAESAGGLSGTAVHRGRLDLASFQLLDMPPAPIFRQLPKAGGTGHFGSRLAFRSDKTLFVTLGERQLGSPAQDLTTHLGKVVRINRDGSVPSSGNPFVGTAGAKPEIWSYGHRNPQGAAMHPTTGELWVLEHGPQGGDELNISRAGGNYGWPIKSYGCDYGVTTANCEIGGGTHAPTYVEPVSRWPAPSVATPASSIAPTGLTFYTGTGFPEWQGSVFLGALVDQALWRVSLSGNVEISRERLFGNLNERIRCVRQGPDGWLYLLTDSGKLIKVDR